MRNGEVTTPYGFVVPDAAGPASSVTTVTTVTAVTSPPEEAPDTKRTPELAMAELSEMSRYPDTVDESQAPSTIASIISCIDAGSGPMTSAPPTSSMMLSSIPEASQSGAMLPTPSTPLTGLLLDPAFDPAIFSAAQALLAAAASRVPQQQQAAPASWDGMVYAPALGAAAPATPESPMASFLATFAPTPAQRIYVAATTAAMTVMAIIIVILAVRRPTPSARAPSAAQLGERAMTSAAVQATTPTAVVCELAPAPAAAATSDATGPVAQADPIEIPDVVQAPVVRNARRGAGPRSTSSAPARR